MNLSNASFRITSTDCDVINALSKKHNITIKLLFVLINLDNGNQIRDRRSNFFIKEFMEKKVNLFFKRKCVHPNCFQT